MSVLRLKGLVLIALIAGYLLFDYAFMQVRIPPVGFGIPAGELFLIAILATTNLPLVVFRLATVLWMPPLLLWWGIGFSRLLADSMGRGFWAFRDATQLIESLYIIVGFAIAAEIKNLSTLIRALPVIIYIAAIYSLGFPFQMEITENAPVLYGASGETVPIIGTYSMVGTILIWGGFVFMIVRGRGATGTLSPIAGCYLIAFAVLVIQARTTYLQLIGITLLLLAVRRKALSSFALTGPVILLLIGIITAFEIRISGRLTDQISLDFLINHIKAIAGSGTDDGGTLADAAAGVALRYGWWERIYRHLTEDAVNLFTGLGYGVPLTDFGDERGVTVREPHNSFISAVARLGLVGFIAWFWLQVELFRSWLRVYRRCRLLGLRQCEDFLALVLAFAILVLISALGEDSLEKPYITIPYYVLWGFVLRLNYLLRTAVVRSEASMIFSRRLRFPGIDPRKSSDFSGVKTLRGIGR